MFSKGCIFRVVKSGDLCGKGLILYQTILGFNPLPDDKILDWSKLKQIADDIWKCVLNEN